MKKRGRRVGRERQHGEKMDRREIEKAKERGWKKERKIERSNHKTKISF